jgi:hypothetical protein
MSNPGKSTSSEPEQKPAVGNFDKETYEAAIRYLAIRNLLAPLAAVALLSGVLGSMVTWLVKDWAYTAGRADAMESFTQEMVDAATAAGDATGRAEASKDAARLASEESDRIAKDMASLLVEVRELRTSASRLMAANAAEIAKVLQEDAQFKKVLDDALSRIKTTTSLEAINVQRLTIQDSESGKSATLELHVPESEGQVQLRVSPSDPMSELHLNGFNRVAINLRSRVPDAVFQAFDVSRAAGEYDGSVLRMLMDPNTSPEGVIHMSAIPSHGNVVFFGEGRGKEKVLRYETANDKWYITSPFEVGIPR